MLWAYKTTSKKLIEKTSFRLTYGQEDVMLMEFIVPSLRIFVLKEITYSGAMEKRL
jgi:hypothetical protein